jgi:[acyl-carrier-protein] S-malonyltransferase
MGRAWADAFPEAREVFHEADEALGTDLSRLCWEGPEADLRLTANTQPALLTTSIAIQRVVAGRDVKAVAMAGHSLGEYSALVAAGVLEFRRALSLVRRRGEFMQEVVPVGEGAMAAIIGLGPEDVEQVALGATCDGEVCAVANFNSPTQTVVAGHAPAVHRAVDLARQQGAKRTLLLEVSAPFHSPLMAPARASLTPFLVDTPFSDPAVPVISNVDAAPVSRGGEAREALIRQVDAPVRWAESVCWMAEEAGVDTFLEIGPGRVLSGLIRRIAPDVRALSLEEPSALEEFLAVAG